MSQLEPNQSKDEVVYLLGISENPTDAVVNEILEHLPIVKTLACNAATGWYVSVDRNQFEGPDAEVNLSDANWLTPRVLAHEAAVEAIGERLAFFPCHFGTVFSNTDLVEELVRQNVDRLHQYFTETAHASEWGLKCIVAWDEAVIAYQREHETTEQCDKRVGLNYLRQQKLIRDRDIKVRDWIYASLNSLEASLDSLAMKLARRRVSSSQSSGQKECLCNFAILLDDSRRSVLADFVERWNEADNSAAQFIELELTGPWPLYSFAPALESPLCDDSPERVRAA